MSSSGAGNENRAVNVLFKEDKLCLVLNDGREVHVPLNFYPRLSNATPEQREKFYLIGEGTGIHWPELDEDLSVEGILNGQKATG